MAAKYDLYIDQGATFNRDFIYKDSDGNVQDLTDYTAQMQIRRSPGSSGDPLLDVNPTVTGAEGKVTLTLTDEQTQGLPAPFEGYYDIEIESPGGAVTRLVQGRVLVDPNVTR